MCKAFETYLGRMYLWDWYPLMNSVMGTLATTSPSTDAISSAISWNKISDY